MYTLQSRKIDYSEANAEWDLSIIPRKSESEKLQHSQHTKFSYVIQSICGVIAD